MKKEHKIFLLVAAAAVAIYLGIRWYENRQAAVNGNTQGGAAEGTNLNSVAPELVGGSTGPSIGPALSTPINIYVMDSSQNPVSANPTGDLVGGSSTPSPLALANPVNSKTGVQGAAPVSSDTPSPAGATSAGTGATYETQMKSTQDSPNVRDQTVTTPEKGPVTHSNEQKKPLKRPGVPRRKKEPVK